MTTLSRLREPRQPKGPKKVTHRVRKLDVLSVCLPDFCDDLNLRERWLKTDDLKGIEADDWRTAIEIVDLVRGGPLGPRGNREPWAQALPKAMGLFHRQFGARAHAYLLVAHFRPRKDHPLRPLGRMRHYFPPTRPTQFRAKDEGSVPALGLWQWIFAKPGYERIRRCRNRKCQAFFVVLGRKTYCESTCKNRYWNRDTRMKAKERHALEEETK
jgi:hypothetical protein